ncbi:MAG: P63C domain-containing protein, partial [Syntrophales bacterium]|nr:P63C domain-containing protein [Syntrophales bacterium]
MSETTLKVTHAGDLKIGAISIPCAVLSDGTRVLTQQGVLKAIGRARSAKGGEGASVDGLPAFLRAGNIKPFISEELTASTTPIIFKTLTGAKAFGYKAELLPHICHVFIDAKEADAILPNQEHIVKQCKILIRGFSTIGIIALVDEATGYQEIRDKRALQEILDQFLAKQFAAWAKRFPDEFYMQMFRLKNWQWKGMKVNRPSCVGNYTKDVIYERLAPGILDELERRNPPNEKGQRKS